MKHFLLGYAAGFGSAVVALIAIGLFWTNPTPVVSLDITNAVKIGEQFTVTLNLHNPHTESIEVDNVEIPDFVRDAFDILIPAGDTTYPIFGRIVWEKTVVLEPGATNSIIVDASAKQSGEHVLEFRVCNVSEDCVSISDTVNVHDSRLSQ